MNAMEFIDRFMEADRRHGLLLTAREKRDQAAACVSKRCGNCDHWMKSKQCPRERNVNGMSKEPSMNDIGCDLFSLTAHSKQVHDKLLSDAEVYVRRANTQEAPNDRV